MESGSSPVTGERLNHQNVHLSPDFTAQTPPPPTTQTKFIVIYGDKVTYLCNICREQ